MPTCTLEDKQCVPCRGDIPPLKGGELETFRTWGRVTIRIWTHAIDGLTESDFVLAAKTDRVFRDSHQERE